MHGLGVSFFNARHGIDSAERANRRKKRPRRSFEVHMAAVRESKRIATRLPGAGRLRSGVVVAFLFAWFGAAHAADCAAPLAQLVLVKGNVELVRQGAMRLAVAEANVALCTGDTVVVHQRSQAALLLANATVVRLDQGTTVTISPSAPGRPALLSVISGAIYVISRTPQPFRVRTPFINANVEGTEFLVEVRRQVDGSDNGACPARPDAPAETDRITVYEGRVRVEGTAAPLDVDAGETVVASATQGPTKVLIVRPRDAVTWTLYVPTIVRSGPAMSAQFACANQLLAEGLLEPAKKELERVRLNGGADDALAYALLAAIAVAENDRAQATAYADRAIELDPNSAAAWLARSYAQQALFRIDEALASADRAASLDPSNALAMARRAELQMSVGRLDDALASAREAVRLDSSVAKTQTVLGFANLMRIDLQAARSSFEGAVALDPTDPLPRLGLGLARIRGGDLAGGRVDIELAALLDPSQSLVRSYLGKAYFDERRAALAASQFKLAKDLDPNDPTPWFYDSLRKTADNQLIEAVEDLLESIRLNGRRAVYRSRLLLDEDLAARNASLARTFLEVDLREAALSQAASSLAVDPGSASAHRFLSDVKAGEPRHEITRASELLQAQLRQPLSATPLQAQLSNDRLFSLQSEGPNAVGFNEFGSLFLANGSKFQLYGVGGSQDTLGGQALYSLVHDNVGFGASALHFKTHGVRPNGDSSEEGGSGFAQWAVSPQTSVQFEFTHQRQDYGDIVSRFDPEVAFTSERNLDRSDDARFGLHHSFSAASDLLVTLNRRDDRSHSDFGGGLAIDVRTKSTRAELQHLFRATNASLLSGASYLEGETTEDVFGNVLVTNPRHLNLYAYSTYAVVPGTSYLQVGASFDHLRIRDAGDQRQLNPKLGFIWNPAEETTVRAAVFRVLKRRINSDAGLEPTQVAGFDQFFDDQNGTRSWGAALGADAKPFDAFRTGVELSGRNLEVPMPNPDESISFEKWRERQASAYAHWTFGHTATLALRLRHTRYERTALATGDEGFETVTTTEAPLSLKVFLPRGFWSSLTVTHVQQRGRFIDPNFDLVDGSDRFNTVDVALGYRLPQRRGNLSAACSNLFGKSFRFQDIGLEGARFAPQRTCLLRLSLDL
jgi:tetratricopeptide (TPR) repeat protein